MCLCFFCFLFMCNIRLLYLLSNSFAFDSALVLHLYAHCTSSVYSMDMLVSVIVCILVSMQLEIAFSFATRKDYLCIFIYAQCSC